MANIKINNLQLTGSDLLIDSESFLDDLSDADLIIHGGRAPEIPPSSCLCTLLTVITRTTGF